MPQSAVKRTVLVSGATGFIGTHVVAELCSGGYQVRAIGRRKSAQLPAAVEQLVFNDLTDRMGLMAAFPGADSVVHLAGLAHVTRDVSPDPLADYRFANVATTWALASAAVAMNASTFILLSSVAALDTPARQSGRSSRRREAYSQSKREAEETLLETASGTRLRPVIIRAPMVYGPNMKGNPLRLFRLIERGVPLPLAGIDNRRSSIYVGNLTAAIRYALENDGVQGTVHVEDKETLSTPEFVRLSAASLGVPARLFHLPTRILSALGRFGDLANRVMPFPVTSEAIERLTDSVVLDTSSPHDLRGFRPPFTAEAGIRATGEWFKGRDKRHPGA